MPNPWNELCGWKSEGPKGESPLFATTSLQYLPTNFNVHRSRPPKKACKNEGFRGIFKRVDLIIRTYTYSGFEIHQLFC